MSVATPMAPPAIAPAQDRAPDWVAAGTPEPLHSRLEASLVFRAGGTSLNGRGQTDSILVDGRRHWRSIRIEDGGARVRVVPGAVLGHVNRLLVRHGRRLGPDPASTPIACVGGVLANNSGGCAAVSSPTPTAR